MKRAVNQTWEGDYAVDYNFGTPALPSTKKLKTNCAYEIRFLVSAKVTGLVIGKGGATISKFRAENMANLHVVGGRAPEGIVIISSDDHQMNMELFGNLINHITEITGKRKKGYSQKGLCNIHLLIQTSQLGKVIGKGGEQINLIRKKTGATVKVYQECCPMSTERVVEISGGVDSVCEVVDQILSITNIFPPLGHVNLYDPCNFDVQLVPNYGGFNETEGRNRAVKQCINSFRRENGNDGGCWTRDGRGSRFHSPEVDNNFDIVEPFDSYLDSNDNAPLAIVTQQVTIPNEFAGAIIGTRGDRIRRTRAESGAEITIADETSGNRERLITMTGTDAQISLAKYLLQQSVKMYGSFKGFEAKYV